MFGVSDRFEPFVVAVVDHRHPLLRDAQLPHDIVLLVVGYGDDALTFLENFRYDQPSIEPAHVLIERFVVLVSGFEEDDVV